MTVTQAMRDNYRFILEDKGVPEVIAFMASKNIDNDGFDQFMSLDTLVGGLFWWSNTPQGSDFWAAVQDEVTA